MKSDKDNKTPSHLKNIVQVLETDSFQQYLEDQKECYEGWQEVFSSSMDIETRYQKDREAYIRTYFESKHDFEGAFNEIVFIKKMRKNFKKAKHPIFLEYRKHLKLLLKESKKINLTPPQFKDIEEIIDLKELEAITTKLAGLLESKPYLKKVESKPIFKSKDALFAFLHSMNDSNKLKVKMNAKNRLNIGVLFLTHYNLSIKAANPIQNLGKYDSITKKTRNFFSDNIK